MSKNSPIYKSVYVRDWIFRIISFILMFLFAFSFIFVFFWMVCNSFREGGDFLARPFKFLNVSSYTFKNYLSTFTEKVGRSKSNVIIATINSLKQMIPCLLMGAFLPSSTGYVAAKYRFPGRRLITFLVIMSMTIPSISATTSTYMFINKLNLYDNFLGIYLMSAAGLGFGFLLYKNFFSGIPWDYAESAQLDGASNLMVFLRIYLPMAKPLLISTAIMGVISYWNDYSTAYLYLPSHPTMGVFIQTIFSSYVKEGANYPKVFAVMTYSTTVTLVLYAIFSKTIMSSMSAGGLKG